MSSKIKIVLIITGFILAMFLSFWTGVGFTMFANRYVPPPAPQGLPAEFRLLSEVYDVLSKEYVEKDNLNPQKLNKGAIQGMLTALGDPYTSFLDKESFRLERSSFEGKFEGIGAQVTKTEKEGLVVIAPLPGSPAEKAGIRAGDRILQVDGIPTANLSLNEAVLKIRGEKGTQVKLLILHEGETKPVELTITRAQIESRTVSWKNIEDIAYVKLSSFHLNTSEELRSSLREINRKGARGIILDLRMNPGGLLNEVVDVAREFLPGKVVLYEQDREGNRKTWKAGSGGLAESIPMVVLVDSYSASGSEVLSGALQDYKRAVIIGTKTFGKGSVNTMRPLSDGSGLYLTIARWITPLSERKIEGKGLMPDIEVSQTKEDREKGIDPPVQKALELLKSSTLSVNIEK